MSDEVRFDELDYEKRLSPGWSQELWGFLGPLGLLSLIATSVLPIVIPN
jgi:hypothetical protein